MPGNNQMSKSDSSRIQGSQARGGGDMSSSGFASRAQSAGDRNANASAGSGSNQGSGGSGSGGRSNTSGGSQQASGKR